MVLLALVLSPLSAGAQVRAQVVASGLVNPVALVMDPVDHSTFYVVEPRGTIRILRNNTVSPEFFLDLRSVISSGGELGLLSLAFPPDAATSRRCYVNFTEGRFPYDSRTAAGFLPLSEPIHDYPRSDGMPITGGFVYRGSALDPMFNGQLFQGPNPQNRAVIRKSRRNPGVYPPLICWFNDDAADRRKPAPPQATRGRSRCGTDPGPAGLVESRSQ